MNKIEQVLYTGKTHARPGARLAQDLIDAAHQICPYSKMTRNNIGVSIALA